MISKPDKNKLRLKRHKRIRGKISGTAECPHSGIFRSSKNIYAQIVDGVAGITPASTSTLNESVSVEETKLEQTQAVSKAVAETAKRNNIVTVIFDRSDHLHRGRIQALADAVREDGLEFQERRFS